MNRKRYITTLTSEEHQALTTLIKTSRLHRERQRGQAILWSHAGYDMASILSLLKVDRDTLSSWLTKWESQGIAGLRDRPHPGRPGKLNAAEKKRS